MLALTVAAVPSGFVQNKQKSFSPPTKVQKCKSALRDKMQTSVDIFLAAGASKQPARERNN